MSSEMIVTAVFGSYTDRLERAFTSFARHTSAQLHALVIGDALPLRRVEGVHYHLVAPDPAFAAPGTGAMGGDQAPFELLYRNACYRRWEILDEIAADYCLVVDAVDVLCLQDLPPIREMLRGAAVAACVEHVGHYYLKGQGYTSNFLNAGVTFWDVAKSRSMRRDILALGRGEFRCVGDDQWVFNEVIQTRYFDDLVILPCQFNFRAFLGPPEDGWPSVSHLDGVRIYHNGHCIEQARALGAVPRIADLSSQPLHPDRPVRTLHLRRPYRWVAHRTGDKDGPLVAG